MEIQERKEWAPWESSGGRSQLPWHRLEHFYLQKLQLLGPPPFPAWKHLEIIKHVTGCWRNFGSYIGSLLGAGGRASIPQNRHREGGTGSSAASAGDNGWNGKGM